MNFLLGKATNPVVPELSTIPESDGDVQAVSHPATTLGGLIGEDTFAKSSSSDDGERDSDDHGGATRSSNGGSGNLKSQVSLGSHSDVTEEEGRIAIPYRELPEDWSNAPDIQSFRSLDRSFVFPGEQLHILACLAASKQDTEVITPFRVAALMSKNGELVQNIKQKTESEATNHSSTHVSDSGHQGRTSEIVETNGGTVPAVKEINAEGDFSVPESLIQMEDHKQYTRVLLERFKNSHFFARIAESDEPLWSKRTVAELNDGVSKQTSSREKVLNSVIDRGNFDAYASGGVARNTVRCFSLCNGDIVVLLQVNVGIDSLKNPVLEILQFEKSLVSGLSTEHNQLAATHEDPCRELLRWLLPLDNALSPPHHPFSPPLESGSGIGGAYHRPTLSASSGSQLFSFSHFRSYSMPSLSQTSIPSPAIVPPPSVKHRSDLEDFEHFSSEKPFKSQDMGTEGHFSFRGVSLEPEQFSVQCGLDGIYLPGKRWRRKLEIIQPIELHSFAADCNTEDLLCVQIKNASPAHIPDVIIFLDAISIVFEEAPKSSPPLSLPISCIEAGNGHSLPNLALRRGEEHSFILKPSFSMARDSKVSTDKSSHPSHLQTGMSSPNMLKIPKIGSGRSISLNANHYAVLVSYRCNYSESKLFLKKPTSWCPRVARDLMLSVASEISEQTLGPEGGISQLPVKALTLQATNLTTEDLTLVVLAPASTTLPSVVSLNTAPTTPISPFAGFPEFMGRVAEDKREGNMQSLSSMPTPENQMESGNGGKRSVSISERTSQISDVVPNSDLRCTHLWLQSAVPLGCVPAQSTATVKLGLLPLTDGIITLDTLQVAIKEKGVTYIPEHSLKIHATSSIATGIM